MVGNELSIGFSACMSPTDASSAAAALMGHVDVHMQHMHHTHQHSCALEALIILALFAVLCVYCSVRRVCRGGDGGGEAPPDGDAW